jgi:hypothetical protein
VSDHVNIFSLARRGHTGEENHLIELLAFLLQQEPAIVPLWLASVSDDLERPAPWAVTTQHVLPTRRRPDLLLERVGEAAILVEVKLGSGEGVRQLADYVRHLQTERSEPLRALIYLVKDDAAAIPATRQSVANVHVYPATWQRFQRVVASGDGGALAQDFAEMLREEGLVTPERLSATDLHEWEHAALVMRRVQQLLDAARPHLEALLPDHNWTGPMSVTGERIYRLYSSDRVFLGVGLNPGTLSGLPAMIDCYIMNKALEPAERRLEARRLRAAHPDDVSHVEWGETLKRSRSATEVLTGATFDEQVTQAVGFAQDSIRIFQRLGYLPSSLR